MKLLTHLAFSNLIKTEDKQLDETIEKILKLRRLKISKCFEFLPDIYFPSPHKYIHDNSHAIVNGESIQISLQNFIKPREVEICYLPENVPMICFTSIPIDKLKTNGICERYGKLGIVFNHKLIERLDPKPVEYYTEDSLLRDLKLRRLMELKKIQKVHNNEVEELEKEILTYRKPAKLTANFGKAHLRPIQCTTTQGKIEINLYQYDRYELGYDFTKEAEWRIAFSKNTTKEYEEFYEDEIQAIIVSSKEHAAILEAFFKKNYNVIPQIIVL